MLEPKAILYQDSSLIAVNKPAGVPAHGSRILADRADSLLRLVRQRSGQLVHLVHRLDRPVSGVMLMAFERQAQAALSRAFEQREVRKCYLAVVRGWTEPEGRIDYPLAPPADQRRSADRPRDAVTDYRRIASAERPWPVGPYATARYSLVALFPETGRRHQLRRHMKHISHHLVGDTTYGRGEHNRLFREHFGCERLLLHASSVTVTHPDDGRKLTVHAPLDTPFQAVIENMGWSETLRDWLDQEAESAKQNG